MITVAHKRKKSARFLLSEAERHAELANKSRTVSVFVENYNQILYLISLLKLYEQNIRLSPTPSIEYDRLNREYQKHLQDALRRETHYRLESAEDLEEGYSRFCEEIARYEDIFSRETLDVADECKNMYVDKFPQISPQLLSQEQLIKRELHNVDSMSANGWEFEEYCAKLLLHNGFINAEVTPKSNDYGVDVVATNSDGVRYAVQCKCYSSKLGNAPIQEVAAGKKYYKCQVGVVMTNNYFTDNAINLAENNGILLWDRDKLKSMIAIYVGTTPSKPNAYKINEENSDPLLPDAIDL